MLGTTFLSSRFDAIESRFEEIDILLNLAEDNIDNSVKYKSLCRSAHVLLVSHVEGIYKDVVKDVLDDLNNNTIFIELNSKIFHTSCGYYISSDVSDKNYEKTKKKLWDTFKELKSDLKLEPFLRVDNKNPMPKIFEDILIKFGEKNFFKSLKKSKLEIVFENDIRISKRELSRIKRRLKKGILEFPYKVNRDSYCSYEEKDNSKGLFEVFLNQLLKDRHSIIHGNTIDSPRNHNEIIDSKIKVEVLLYAFIMCLCLSVNPVRLM